MDRIGERIKKKRELIGLQLNELAEKVGITPSALSQIEKSKSNPSVLTLKSIAENLHTGIGELVGENESFFTNALTRRIERKLITENKSGTILYQLSHHDTNNNMSPYLLHFSKTSAIEELFDNLHGQVFCHLLTGEVRFTLKGKDHFLLQGDSIYFNAKTPHNAINNHEGISEMLWIQSPSNIINSI